MIAAPEPLLVAKDLRREFVLQRHSLFAAPRRIVAVDGVSFAIPRGGTFGLVGESGSGKTTVARLLLKLDRPTAGTVSVDGADIFSQDKAQERAYRRTVQAVLQDPYGALSQRMRVGGIVAEPLRAQGMGQGDALAVAARMLEAVGLGADALAKYPHEFSGGQRQRIAVARALSVEPKLLVLDEPVSALDVSVRAQILTLLRDMQQRLGLTYLCIGHDLAIVKFMSTLVGVMYFGRMVEIGPAAALFRRPRHPYTRKLVAAATGRQKLGADRLTGEMPNPLAPPSGCHFRTRCAYAAERCTLETPVLTELDSGHSVACHFAAALPEAA
jgi:oligopeptide/dipeptide ABC transporter ATP-binding protein